MDHDLQKILNFDDEFHETFNEVGNRFMPIIKSSNYPQTIRTLIGLMTSANSIKLGIYDLAEESDTNLYVIKILHRTLIEHYLKYYYILFRFLNEKSDEVGIEYRKYSYISETLSYVNASSVSISITGKNTEDQVLKILKKEHPEFEISKKVLNEIVSKWKHRSIVKYIKKNTNIILTEKSYILKLIPEYAELSSFVHGGTFAEEYYHGLFDEGKLEETVYNEVHEAAIMAATMKLHLMIAVVVIDNTFSKDIAIMSRIIGDFIKNKSITSSTF